VNPESHSRTAPLFPVLLVNFIGTLGFSIVLPFLVFVVLRIGGNALIYGIVGATYPALQMIGAPILGRWSDRYGRRRILLLSQTGTLLSWVLFAVALFLPVVEIAAVDSPVLGNFRLTVPLLLILVARALDGLTGGNISVANAYVADISPEEDRNRNFGRMGVSSNLGFIVGPALAGLLGGTALGEQLPVLAALVVSLVATLLVGFYLPESRPCDEPERTDPTRVGRLFGQEHRSCYEARDLEKAASSSAWSLPQIPRMLTLYLVVFLAFNLFYTAFPIRAAGDLGWEVTDTGAYFAVLSAIMVVVQGPVLGALSRRFSETALIVSGGVILATNFALLLSASTTIIYVAAVLFAVGNGIMWPSVQSLLSKLAGDEKQGVVQGIAGGVGGLASIVGLIAGGLLFEAAGASTFLVSAALIVMSCGIALPLFWMAPRAGADRRDGRGSPVAGRATGSERGDDP
jgi:DHA1 family tetracycline resistance protein-like MFS transporter